jgi:hypothetical protein
MPQGQWHLGADVGALDQECGYGLLGSGGDLTISPAHRRSMFMR